MMMKKYGLITKVLLISMFAILLNGCENSLTSEFSTKTDETKFYTITGNINVDAISAENSPRTGLPTIPSDDIKFSVSATKDGETINGKVTEMQYSIALPKGSWTVTVIGKKDKVTVFEGSINVNPEDESTTQQTITLKTIKNEGNGSLSLTITKDEGLSCGGVKVTFGNESVEYLTFNTDNNPIQWKNENLEAGTYSIKLDFYQEMTISTDAAYSCKNLLYSHHDTVNIFANFTTDTWTGSGYSDNSFKLTQAMIDNFAMSTFYVSGNGDDSNAGTYFLPLKTVQAAVDKVIDMNENVKELSENAPYRILLLSDITDETTESYLDNNNALVNINPTKKLYLEIASYQDACTVNANRTYSSETDTGTTGRVMYIGENANVTLKNLNLTGGYLKYSDTSEYKGAGLYILNSNATVTIENCEISGNTINNGCGAGIFVALNENQNENLKLIIENSTISSNTINHTDEITEYSGAGIAIENVEAVLIITGSEISDNKINQVSSDNLRNDKGVGLWLGNNATTTISGTTVENNKIENEATCNTNAGGGICIEGGTLTINETTTISENTASNGGGVYVGNGTFTMNGNAVVNSNNDVYLTSGTTVTVAGNLTGTTPVATITPEKYEVGILVLSVADGVTLSDVVGKIAVTPQTTTDGTSWSIDTEGKLYKENAYYVSKSGSDSNIGNVSSPFATVQKAVDTINGINDGYSSYTIYVMDDIQYENLPSGKNEFINIVPSESLNLKICSYGSEVRSIDAQQKGGVMYIANNSTDTSTNTMVTLENITLTGGKAAGAGGVVIHNGGLIMNSGVTISNCESTGRGGAVNVSGGTLTMNSGVTISNCISNIDGGAIYITNAGTFNMLGGTISDCTADLSGGGVWMDGGSSFIMSGNSEIKSCTAKGNEGGGVHVTGEDNPCSFVMKDNASITKCNVGKYGGGVSYGCGISNDYAFTMEGNASITSCKASSYGGAVYLHGNLIMTGGTISKNNASSGAGVYVRNSNSVFSSLSMSGNAVVNSNNDVYLTSGTTVTVAGNLTGTTPVATITPSSYNVNTQVLKAGSDTTGTTLVNLAEQVSKFAVTPSSDGINWSIDTNGKIKQQ